MVVVIVQCVCLCVCVWAGAFIVDYFQQEFQSHFTAAAKTVVVDGVKQHIEDSKILLSD